MFEWFRKRQRECPNPHPVDPVCFVCEGSPPAFERDGPGHWLSPRYACRDHCHAALLSSGEALASFLSRHAGEYPLEGSGLGWLLNPVSVAGKRAWADFAGGGWAVLEEVFTSDSQFDFWAQHRPDCVDALYWMHPPAGAQAGRPTSAVSGRSGLSRAEFVAQWGFHHGIESGFRLRGSRHFTSPAELLEFWESLRPHGDWQVAADEAEFDGYVRVLAERRFQRLHGPAEPLNSLSSQGMESLCRRFFSSLNRYIRNAMTFAI
jgi:hypothetical protein